MPDEPQRPAPILPAEAPQGATKSKNVKAALLAAAALAALYEGFSGKVYYDPAHIPTQGYGETQDIDPTRIWSKDEAMARLRQRMARDYAPKIERCVPTIDEHPNAFGAMIDASYNAGPKAVCNSPMARAFNAGRLHAACQAFVGWYTTARDRRTGVRKQLPGLVKRRNAESSLCMKDVAR
jgi:lysozyme